MGSGRKRCRTASTSSISLIYSSTAPRISWHSLTNAARNSLALRHPHSEFGTKSKGADWGTILVWIVIWGVLGIPLWILAAQWLGLIS